MKLISNLRSAGGLQSHFIELSAARLFSFLGVLLVAFAALCSSASAGQLFSASFVDEKTGYAVGMGGTLLITKDGGENWAHLDPGIDIDLYSISFTSKPGTGFIAGGSMVSSDDENPYHDTGYLLKTTNGGGAWEMIYELDGYTITSIRFFEAGRNGYLIGDDYHPENTASKLYYTDTYGLVWTEELLSRERGYYLSGMTFSEDGDTGFVIGSYMDAPEEGADNADPVIGSVVFRKAPDMPEWKIVLDAKNVIFRDVALPPGEEKVYLIGNNSTGGTVVQSSVDNGKSWKQMAEIENEVFFSVAFPSRSVGFASGAGVTGSGPIRFIARTDNSGRDWRKVFVEAEHDLWDVFFASENLGVFTGGTVPVTPEPVQALGKAVVVLTRDGGKTFDKQILD